MNQKPILVALLGLLLTFISCNLVDEDITVNQPVPHIKKITTIRGLDTTYVRLEYDASWRLVRWITSYGHLTIYSYQGDTINVQVYQNDGTPNGDPDFITLNDYGWIKTKFRGAYTFQYDYKGYLTEKVAHSNQNLISRYTILNGNTTQVTEMFDSDPNTLEITRSCKFVPHSINTIGEENMGRPYCGKQNKELIFTEYDPSRGVASTKTYHYELDAQKRVAKRFLLHGPTDIYTYYE